MMLMDNSDENSNAAPKMYGYSSSRWLCEECKVFLLSFDECFLKEIGI
jgi:hypothetical protein